MRKSNLVLKLAFFGGLVVGAAVAVAQPATQPLMVKMLKTNVYEVEGGGGNTGIIIGDKGVIVIDAKTTQASGTELVDAVKKLTDKPITTVILTHSVKVCLATRPCDLRKSFDTLSVVVRDELREDPLSRKVFVFLNRQWNRVS